jgi:hypothetical protein
LEKGEGPRKADHFGRKSPELGGNEIPDEVCPSSSDLCERATSCPEVSNVNRAGFLGQCDLRWVLLPFCLLRLGLSETMLNRVLVAMWAICPLCGGMLLQRTEHAAACSLSGHYYSIQ